MTPTAIDILVVIAAVLFMCGIVLAYDLLADHYGWERL